MTRSRQQGTFATWLQDGRPTWALVIPWPTTFPGGVTEVVLNLAAGLQERGQFRVMVLVFDWTATRPRVEFRDGIPHVHVRFRERSPSHASRRAKLGFLLRAWLEHRRIFRLLRLCNVRILNFHFPLLAAEAFVDARKGPRPGYRTILSLHGRDIMDLPQRSEDIRRRYAWMLSRADAVTAVSGDLAATVQSIAPELGARLSIMHNGVDSEHFVVNTATVSLTCNKYILNVASYEKKKGQIFLLKAFSEIADQYPDLHLVMAGGDSDQYEYLRVEADSRGLGQRVIMLREVPHSEIGSLFTGATLFCLSSIVEPFGIVILESGICGVPVIASNVGGVPEIIRDGQDGVLVAPGDVEQLKSALCRLLDDDALARRLADSLRARVLDEFTWRKAVDRYSALATSLWN